MNAALKLIVFILPSLGILGGLSLAPAITLFLVLFLVKARSYVMPQDIDNPTLYMPRLAGYLLLAWCGVSIMWSHEQSGSLILFSKVTILFMLCSSICCSNISKEGIERLRFVVATPLLLGLGLAFMIFATEYFSSGAITIHFRNMFQPEKGHIFHLPMLDRGCAFLAVISWVLIGWLAQNGSKITASFVFLAVLFLLALSDSLASLVSFTAAGLVFLLVCISRRFIWLVMIAVLAIGVATPLWSYHMKPREISEEFSHELPLSAKHRLFIWHFVAEKIEHNEIFGRGFNISNNIATDDDVVTVEEHKLPLLPLHPHNNVLQILLETGVIGLALYMTLALSILAVIHNRFQGAAAPTAAFVTYFSIGMISFGLWQTWWVASGLFAFLIAGLLLNRK